MSDIQSLYDSIREYFQSGTTHLIYLSKFYIHQFKTSYLYQKIISNYYGISIAEKYHHTLKIPYIYEGTQYFVYVPFEKKYIHKMRNQNVILYYDDNDVQLNQQPGVPYLISPKHVGAKWAKSYSIEGEKKFSEKESIVVQ